VADQAVLSELERNLINYCESEWFLKGVLPTPETLCEKFKLTPHALNKILNNDLVKKSFNGRGMPIIEGRDLPLEQITAINEILNTTDTRSQKKKLQDLGISAQQWNGWKRNANFKEYYKKRVEQIFGDALPDVHMALMDRAVNGDLGALKFYYEITGHYTGDGKAIDMKMILERVFEIISLHVKEPTKLAAIAGDLLKLAGVDSNGTLLDEAPVAGEIVKGELNVSNPHF
jgi:hypothetical protein